MDNKKQLTIFPFVGNSKIPGAELGPIEIMKELQFCRRNKFSYQIFKNTSQGKFSLEECVFGKFNKKITLILGGDHSTTSYIFNNYINLDIPFIIFDAHNDRCLDFDGSYSNWNVINHLESKISSGILIGYRDIRESMPESPKFKYFHDYEMMSDIGTYLKEYLLNRKKVYISIDVDSINPVEFPGTGYKCPGGIFVRELLYYLKIIIENTSSVIIDLVEYNPLIEKSNSILTLKRIIDFITFYM